MRLTLLAPDILEMLMNGRQPRRMNLIWFQRNPLPVEWEVRLAEKDTPLMRALGMAHYWQRLLEDGRVASVAEIAQVECMDVTQVRRVMRLILLAPEVVEGLVGAPDAVLEKMMRRPWSSCWAGQSSVLSLSK